MLEESDALSSGALPEAQGSDSSGLAEELSRARELLKAGKFEEAAAIFRKVWEQDPRYYNWEGYFYARALYKLRKYEECLEVCRTVYRYHEGFEPIRSLYGWCIFRTALRSTDRPPPEKTLDRAVRGIQRLIAEPKRYEKGSPYIHVILRAARFYKMHQCPEKVIECLRALDPSQLSKEVFQFKAKGGKVRELASDFENYYSLLTWALEETQQWEECKEACETALSEISTFHYDNDIWIRRRLALAYEGLNQLDAAAATMKKVFLQKGDWYMAYEYARMLRAIGKIDEAIRWAAEGLFQKGNYEKKLKLYRLMHHLMVETNQEALARSHLELELAYRQERNYPIPQSLEEKIRAYGIRASELSSPHELVKILRFDWQNLRVWELSPRIGWVTKLKGPIGFVREENTSNNYFFLSKEYYDNSKKYPLEKGMKVGFYLREGYDRKKRRVSLNAFQLYPITIEDEPNRSATGAPDEGVMQ